MSLSLLEPASPFLVPSMTPSDPHMLGNTPVSACVYKKVARKVRPVPASLPEDFCVVYHIPSDPLLSMPALSPHPPEFVPGLRLTEERLEALNLNKHDFLWPEELKLLHQVLKINEYGLVLCPHVSGLHRDRKVFVPYL